jgi:hypothetical protein
LPAHLDLPPAAGYSHWWALGEIGSEGDGRLRMLRLPALLLVFALGAAPGGAGGEPGRDYTDGYMPVAGEVRHVQTFKATGPTISEIRLRLARPEQVPEDDLFLEIREPGKAEPLAKGTIPVEWRERGPKVKDKAVLRYYQWFTAKIEAKGLEKGRTYELVISSPDSFESMPWLVNCFYRDTYPDGEYRRERAGKPIIPRPGTKFDLVFSLSSEGGEITSVPRGLQLEAQEHFGLGHDGKDLLAGTDLKRPPRQLRAWPAPDGLEAVPAVPAVPAPPVPEPLPVANDGPKLSREGALAAAAKDGKVLWSLADPADPDLLWIAVEGKFLRAYSAAAGSLNGFGDYLKLIGREQLDAAGAACGPNSVWVATDRGALVYDRKTRSWSQCAINLDLELLDVPVEKVWLTAGGVAFRVKGRGSYEFDAAARKWTRLKDSP